LAQDRISKRSIDSLFCPQGKDREFLWDDALAGFGVAAFASGKKVYVVQYRKDGRSRRVSLGEHGRLTPDEARSMAKTVLGQVEQGADPVEERRKARAIRTFREVAEDFIKLHVAMKRKGGTKADYEALLNRFIYPAIGSKRIVDIRRPEVSKLHAKLAAKPYTGNRVLALISSIWNWAAKGDEVEFANNPAKGIERNEEKKRERFLSNDELGRLGETLRLAETIGLEWTIDESKLKSKHAPKNNRRTKIDQHAAAAIRLLIFTGARLREILHARWEHVDFERSIIHLPDSKTGAKPIYLSAAALDVLRDLPRLDGNPYVIPGEKDGAPRADLKKPWSAVTKAAGIEGTRIHDLRHSFASVGAGASLGLPIIGKLLGHSQAATTHRYAHLDADPMHKAVNTIGASLSAAMNGEVKNNVVAIKGTRNAT
jgi:integrase